MEPRFSHLDSEMGLSDDQVKCFIQDERGYIWIGTSDGLNRYDGHTCIPFKTNGTSSALSGNNISALDLGENGLIWVGTSDGGLCSIDPLTFNVSKYPISEQYENFTERILSIKYVSSKSIYIGYEKAPLISFNPSSSDFEILSDTVHFASPSIYSMTYDDELERLYYGYIHGGLRWNQNTVESRFEPAPSLNKYPAYTINCLYQIGSSIWAGAWDNALHNYNLNTGLHTYFTLDNGPIDYSSNEISALDSSKSLFWVGTLKDGLYLFDSKSEKFKKIDSRPNDPGRFKGTRVETIYKDARDRIWIGTEEGVNIYDPLLNQFEVHFMDDQIDVQVNCFAEYEDEIIAGTSKGLIELDRLKDNGNSYEELSIYDMKVSKSGDLLIGTDKSIFKLESGNEQVELLPTFKFDELEMYWDIPSSRVVDIEEISIGQEEYILAFFYGYDLLFIDPADGHATPNHIGRDNSYENLVKGLVMDSSNRLWAHGASKGVVLITDELHSDSIRKADKPPLEGGYRYNIEAVKYQGKGTGHIELACNDVSDMIEYEKGKFYLLTSGCGLYQFIPESIDGAFISLNCPINNLQSAVLDNDGQLWVLSSKGILRYSPSEKNYTLYGKEQGIPTKYLNGELFKGSNGSIYVGGIGVYMEFDPQKINRNALVRLNYLDRVIINDTLNLDFDVHHELPYNQNFIRFAFSSPNLTDPNSNKHQYRLKGLEEDWRETASLVQAEYTSLPEGDYSLEVSSSNNSGVFNSPQTLFSFSITPPWWRTWWFFSIIMLSISTLLYALYRYRVSQIKKLFAIRNEIAKDLHDDIGSTLGSISIYSEVAKSSLKEGEKANEVIDIIGETSRNMVDRVSDIVWTVNPANDGLINTIDRMRNFASPLFRSKDIEFRFDIDDGIEGIRLSMNTRKNVFLIFKESVYNILKYADCTEVDVYIENFAQKIKMNIKDNGKGFDPEELNTYNGNGLSNMKERAEEINGKLEITSMAGMGTMISLEFHN